MMTNRDGLMAMIKNKNKKKIIIIITRTTKTIKDPVLGLLKGVPLFTQVLQDLSAYLFWKE